jgi:hypothetical protein
MKFLFLKEKRAKEIYDDMLVTLGEQSPCNSTVKNWVARFKTGHFSTKDEDHPGRPLVVTVPENAVYSMILTDQRISAKNIAETVETLEVSWDHVGFMIRDMLDMRRPLRMPCLLWMTSLQPNLQHSVWMI